MEKSFVWKELVGKFSPNSHMQFIASTEWNMTEDIQFAWALHRFWI